MFWVKTNKAPFSEILSQETGAWLAQSVVDSCISMPPDAQMINRAANTQGVDPALVRALIHAELV